MLHPTSYEQNSGHRRCAQKTSTDVSTTKKPRFGKNYYIKKKILKGYARERKTCGLAQYFPCMASTISNAHYTILFLKFPFVLKLILFSAIDPCSSPQGRAAGELLHLLPSSSPALEGDTCPEEQQGEQSSICLSPLQLAKLKHLLME